MKGQSPQSFTSSSDEYLTHYWPIENGEMRDIIDSKDMEQGNLTSFIEDRFGNVNSALALNGGYTQIPSGVYFNSPELTISAWIHPTAAGNYRGVAGAHIGLFNLLILINKVVAGPVDWPGRPPQQH